MSNPELNPILSAEDGTVDANQTDGASETASYETETSSSTFNWRTLCLFLVWFIGAILLTTIILSYYGCCRSEPTKKEKSQTVGDSILDPIDYNINDVVVSYGLWKANMPRLFGDSYDDTCYSTFRVPYFDVRAPLVVARVAAVIATSLGGVWFLVTVKISVKRYTAINDNAEQEEDGRSTKKLFIRFAFVLALTAITQILPLVFMVADLCPLASNSCDLGYGAVSIITAAAYWLLAAIAVACLPL
ncbi:hypothetical protein IV203_022483 [Nitzschia inconspicua]|uniref:Uncharacterized protein n=1 Tax=Nitzschia inconspicua TaxID=303405 RepID=A0A9K3K786_9STRA|nr:hypothetical protein IV203_022735 [Nitzschia inconspicua]KAG7344475.1 hypothetical protein IV203_022483 [Nitzschia inconspicua]